MSIGLQIPRFTWPGAPGSIGPKFVEIGRTADEAGFASIWVMDHFFRIGVVGEAEEPMLDVLEGHCEDVGCDYDEIEKTGQLGPEGMSSDEVVEVCREMFEAGIEHLIFDMPNVHEIGPLETFGQEIIPTLAEF
jgi:hypothetical protein